MKELTIRQLNRLADKPLFSVKDPVSALTHLIGFIASVVLTPLIFIKASYSACTLADLIALCVYRLSVSLLYAASTTYHTFILPERPARILKKFDHMSIFVMIAGTYTPVCLILMNRNTGIPLLMTVWSVAAVGMLVKAFWVYCPKYVSSIIYIAMGWAALFKIKTIRTALGPGAFTLLLTGGIFYTVGGIIYALKIRFNDDWSEHEIFHLLILLGSLCHYILIFTAV
ncbi:MAG: hemolysin III family protein [Erysipelotrichaceae bacterium]|nr:hemolysin III family protein [Erysipelotrichaceae bacterium]